MMGLNDLKNEISSLIGAPCMVQRDRTGRALFFSDYLRRGITGAAARLEGAGYTVAQENGCAHIGLTMQKGAQFLKALPEAPDANDHTLPAATRAMLQRHAGHAGLPDADTLHKALHLWDAGRQDELALFLQTTLALALRSKQPVPVLLLRLIEGQFQKGASLC